MAISAGKNAHRWFQDPIPTEDRALAERRSVPGATLLPGDKEKLERNSAVVAIARDVGDAVRGAASAEEASRVMADAIADLEAASRGTSNHAAAAAAVLAQLPGARPIDTQEL